MPDQRESPSDEALLQTMYQNYIRCLNERRLEDLPQFVHDQVTHNGRFMTCAGYQAFIAQSIDAIPDLHFNVVLLVAAKNTIASKIAFRCTPDRPFLGHPPTGRQSVFDEHVFYRIEEGRIRTVYSLIDEASVARQMSQTST